MKRLALLFAIAVLTATLSAETLDSRLDRKHQIKIGIGDAFMYGTFGSVLTNEPMNTPLKWEHYYATPHLFAQYEYRVNSWFSTGLIVDFLSYGGKVINTETGERSSRMTLTSQMLVPFNFTYVRVKNFSMYSGFALGYMNVKFANEQDQSFIGMNFTPFGFSFGERIFVDLEIGCDFGLTFIQSSPSLTFPGDRLFTLGIGYRF